MHAVQTKSQQGFRRTSGDTSPHTCPQTLWKLACTGPGPLQFPLFASRRRKEVHSVACHHHRAWLAHLATDPASVLALALIIERSIALRREKILPATLLSEVIASWNKRQMSPKAIATSSRIRRWGGCWPLRCATTTRRVRGEAAGRGCRRGGRQPAEQEPDAARLDRLDRPVARTVRHGRRHDRDLRLAAGRFESAGTGARHLDRAVLHGLRHHRRRACRADAPPLPPPGRRLSGRHGRSVRAAARSGLTTTTGRS